MKFHLTVAFYVLVSGSLIVLAQDPVHPHEYVVSTLDYMKTHEIGPRCVGITGCITRLQNLKTKLPATETDYKALIDKGVIALEKMRDDQDDSKFADLSALGVKFAQHYRTKLPELQAAPQSELSQAYNAFLGLELGDRGEPPPRFFEYLLGEILFDYVHFYSLPDYNQPIPEYAKTAMIDSLEWLTPTDELFGEGELNSKLPYYFATLWDRVLIKLDGMDAAQRRVVLTELESVLANEPGIWGTVVATAARANLDVAKARFP